MRNLAIAQGLVQEDMVQKAWYILCAHDNNPDIAGHWQEWQRLVGRCGAGSLSSGIRRHRHRRAGRPDGLGNIHADPVPSLGALQ